MGRPRPRPWSPRGEGFRRIFDGGVSACWMRREPDGTVTCVVYLACDGPCDGSRDGIWTLTCDPGAPILHNIVDKPWRVAWTLDGDGSGGTLLDRRPLPGGPRRRAPKTRGRHGRREVRCGAGYWLPRKFRTRGTRRG